MFSFSFLLLAACGKEEEATNTIKKLDAQSYLSYADNFYSSDEGIYDFEFNNGNLTAELVFYPQYYGYPEYFQMDITITIDIKLRKMITDY